VLVGAGVIAGAALHAVKIRANPIAALSPKVLIRFIVFLLCSSTQICCLALQQTLILVYQRRMQILCRLCISYAILSFLSGGAWQFFIAARYPLG
jgi:hypothetical protein